MVPDSLTKNKTTAIDNNKRKKLKEQKTKYEKHV